MLFPSSAIRVVLLAGGPALGAATRTPALAPVGPPPLETYTCYQTFGMQYTYMGLFRLQPGGVYGWASAPGKPTQAGHYTVSGPHLRFTDGPLRGATGTYSLEARGRHAIETKQQGKKLYASDDGIITQECQCNQHDPVKPSK